MNTRVIAVVLSAVALFGGGIAGALALTGEDNGKPGTAHTMPDGSMMGGNSDEMNGTHTMENGSEMPGMDMTP